MTLGQSILHNPDFRYRTTTAKIGQLPSIVSYFGKRVEAEACARHQKKRYPEREVDVVQQIGVVLGRPIRWRMNAIGEMEVITLKTTNFIAPSVTENP